IWANDSIAIPDAVTQELTVVQPVPDNQSDGNAVRDNVFGFGDRIALAVANGRVFVSWAGNLNGGRSPNPNDSSDQTTWLRQNIYFNRFSILAGPRIIDSTMGPAEGVTVSGFTFNNTYNATGQPLVDGFAVVFDRIVDPATFTAAAVQVKF